jgi:G3E family GTPase
LLENNFLLKVVNPDLDNPHVHDHDHDEEEGDDGEEGEEGEEEEEKIRLYKKDRIEALEKKQKGIFKDLYRSKGFFWLATRSKHFFEWSSSGIANNVTIGGPWIIGLEDEESKQTVGNWEEIVNDFVDKELGDRKIQLVFIGKHMKD